MKKKEPQYDVIIIGSGLGGLTAGAQLAKAGKKVLVIEQHEVPGGCATTFKINEYTMETSLHELDGLDEHDLKVKIFKDLNVFDHVEFLKLPEFYRFTNGRIDVVIPHDPQRTIELLSKKFPDQEKGIKKYFAKIFAISKEITRLPLQRWKWFFFGPLFPLFFPNLMRHSFTTVGDFLDSIITNDDLKLLLLGNLFYYHDDPYRTSLIYYASGQASYYTGGGHYIKGGSQQLSNHLANIITDAGGKVLTNNLVEKIITKDGKVIGVTYRKTNDQSAPKKQALASIIIANAAVPNVVHMLDQPEQSILNEKIKNLEIAPSFFIVYLTFKKAVKDLGNQHYTTFVFDESIKTPADIVKNTHQNYEQRLFTFTDYSQIDSDLAPAGKSVGVLCTVDYAEDWQNLSKQEYGQKKERVAQILLDRLELLIPGIKQQIDSYQASTPTTIERYTLNPNGSVYGFAQTPKQAGAFRVPIKSPIKNLYFASAWTMPGGGFSGVIWSGMLCSREVLKRI